MITASAQPNAPRPIPALSTDPREHIFHVCKTLFAEEQVAELRILGLGAEGRVHGASGWFNDIETLAKTAANFDQLAKPEGIYVTLNPVHPGCLARSNNGVKEWLKTTTSDRDILARHWLPIDIDPTRPAGISATDAEVQEARTLAREVDKWLTTQMGFPAGVRAFSGNGWHLLYRVELPNDAGAAKLVQRCLESLHARFSTSSVKVDTSNWNASRIFKLYGTLARKGSELPDRPHRRSLILPGGIQLPEFAAIGVVSIEKLEALAAMAPTVTHATPATPATPSENKASRKTPAINDNPNVLQEYLQDHGVHIRKVQANGDGTLLFPEICPFEPDHGNGSDTAIKLCANGRILFECKHDRCQGRTWPELRRMIHPDFDAPTRNKKSAPKAGASGDKSAEDLMDIARAYVDDLHTVPAGCGLAWWRDEFWAWGGRSYIKLSNSEQRAFVLSWLDRNGYTAEPRKAKDIVGCLAALCHVPFDVDLPVYLDADAGPQQRNWISMSNGIIDLDEVVSATESEPAQLRPHTPRWFSSMHLPYAYDPSAGCPLWLERLDEIFDGDQDRIDLLQQILGYCISDDTRLQAIFILEGLPRSGKGTILRQLQKLVGPENCASPRLSGLGDQFGLAALVGKKLAILPDAHLGHGDKALGILETLKLISGEDGVEVHRKHLPSIPNARLKVRFVMAVNELPKFADHGKTLASRVTILPFRKSFVGREDRNLEKKLAAELPGVFNWAVAGLRRLLVSEEFVKPDISRQIEKDFARLCSPIQSFLDDTCELAPDIEVQCSILWSWWEWWAKKNGHLVGSQESFAVRLRSLCPAVSTSNPKTIWETDEAGNSKQVRRRFYVGIGLRAEAEMTG